jgi:hypothetical protein
LRFHRPPILQFRPAVLVGYNGPEPIQVSRHCRFGEPLLHEQVEFHVLESKIDFVPILVYTHAEECGYGSCEEFCFVSPS